MFGRKKKHKVQYQDYIWMTAEMKTNKLLALADDDKPVLIVSSFDKTLKHLQTLKPSFKILESLSDTDNNSGPWLLNSKKILEAPISQPIYSGEVHIAFTEHYPMPDKDHEIISKIASAFEHPSISFYLSLEDPLLTMFNSGKIMELMKRMGMDENDNIEHRMISSAIVNAQKKLAKKVRLEQYYDDEETWYRMNYRD
ncbi:MAG: hypothetical protein JXR53_01915 [Bacteroidales bacterium]|nr:hypothetical protein [Bacteroidales bacterium]